VVFLFLFLAKYLEVKVCQTSSNKKIEIEGIGALFSSPFQRQCKLLPSLGIRRPLIFHILIFSSENP
jgi:hypothetical protein